MNIMILETLFQSGPLAYCVHRIGTMELVISVRRVKGLELLEGNIADSKAVQGANSLLFFLTDEVRSLHVARQRLDKLRSLPGGAEVWFTKFRGLGCMTCMRERMRE